MKAHTTSKISGTLLEKLFPAGGYDSTSPQPPGSGNPSSPFYNSSIAARAQGVIARIRTLDYGSTGGFSIPSIDIQSQINFTPVDQTITAAQRTIASFFICFSFSVLMFSLVIKQYYLNTHILKLCYRNIK